MWGKSTVENNFSMLICSPLRLRLFLLNPFNQIRKNNNKRSGIVEALLTQQDGQIGLHALIIKASHLMPQLWSFLKKDEQMAHKARQYIIQALYLPAADNQMGLYKLLSSSTFAAPFYLFDFLREDDSLFAYFFEALIERCNCPEKMFHFIKDATAASLGKLLSLIIHYGKFEKIRWVVLDVLAHMNPLLLEALARILMESTEESLVAFSQLLSFGEQEAFFGNRKASLILAQLLTQPLKKNKHHTILELLFHHPWFSFSSILTYFKINLDAFKIISEELYRIYDIDTIGDYSKRKICSFVNSDMPQIDQLAIRHKLKVYLNLQKDEPFGDVDLIEQIKKDMSAGFCWGASLLYAVFNSPVINKGYWWSDLLFHISKWDETKDSLNTLISLIDSEKPETLKILIERAINYFVSTQGSSLLDNINQGYFLQGDDTDNFKFQIAKKNSMGSYDIRFIKHKTCLGGHFSKDQLIELLEANKEAMGKHMCWLEGDRHICIVRHDMVREKWIFYDSNDSRGDWLYDTAEKLVDTIFRTEFMSADTVLVMTSFDHELEPSINVLNNLRRVDLLKESGFHFFVCYSSHHFRELMIYYQENTELASQARIMIAHALGSRNIVYSSTLFSFATLHQQGFLINLLDFIRQDIEASKIACRNIIKILATPYTHDKDDPEKFVFSLFSGNYYGEVCYALLNFIKLNGHDVVDASRLSIVELLISKDNRQQLVFDQVNSIAPRLISALLSFLIEDDTVKIVQSCLMIFVQLSEVKKNISNLEIIGHILELERTFFPLLPELFCFLKNRNMLTDYCLFRIQLAELIVSHQGIDQSTLQELYAICEINDCNQLQEACFQILAEKNNNTSIFWQSMLHFLRSIINVDVNKMRLKMAELLIFHSDEMLFYLSSYLKDIVRSNDLSDIKNNCIHVLEYLNYFPILFQASFFDIISEFFHLIKSDCSAKIGLVLLNKFEVFIHSLGIEKYSQLWNYCYPTNDECIKNFRLSCFNVLMQQNPDEIILNLLDYEIRGKLKNSVQLISVTELQEICFEVLARADSIAFNLSSLMLDFLTKTVESDVDKARFLQVKLSLILSQKSEHCLLNDVDKRHVISNHFNELLGFVKSTGVSIDRLRQLLAENKICPVINHIEQLCKLLKQIMLVDIAIFFIIQLDKQIKEIVSNKAYLEQLLSAIPSTEWRFVIEAVGYSTLESFFDDHKELRRPAWIKKATDFFHWETAVITAQNNIGSELGIGYYSYRNFATVSAGLFSVAQSIDLTPVHTARLSCD